MGQANRATGRAVKPTLSATLQSCADTCRLFARHLASRPDLLDADIRADLARVVVFSEVMPWVAVRRCVADAIGRDLGAAFMTIEVTPVSHDSFTQAHRARLCDGRPVTVTLVNTAAVRRFESQMEQLPRLRQLLDRVLDSAAFADVMEDFRDTFEERRNLTTRVEAHRRWHQRPIDDFAAPALQERFSGASMLTVDRLPLRPVLPGQAQSASDIAHRCCAVWLRLATAGLPFPTEIRPDAFGLTEDDRLTFGTVPVATLDESERTDLWEYLAAVAEGDVEKACVRLLAHTRGSGSAETLQHEFRQLVPFRDGPWRDATSTVAEQLFIQWQRASAAQRLPAGNFRAVYRGLYSVCVAARNLDCGGDHLGNAIRAERIIHALDEMRAFVSGSSSVVDIFDRYAPFALGIPSKIDTALDVGVRKGADRVAAPGSVDTRSRHHVVPLLAVSVLLASAALVLPRLAHLLNSWPADQRLAGILLLAAALLVAAARGHGSWAAERRRR